MAHKKIFYQQLFSGSLVDLNKCAGKFDISHNVLPESVTDERPSTKTPPSTSQFIAKPVAQKVVNNQSAAYISSSQSYQDAEHPQQEQAQQNYRDPPATNTQNSLLLGLKRSSQTPIPQRITKRSRSLPLSKTSSQALLDAQKSTFIQELGLQERVNQNSTTCNNLAADSESHQSNDDYQHPYMEKTTVAQAAETENVETNASQTNEWLRKEQPSFCKETAVDTENPSEQESRELENEVVPNANQDILTVAQNLKSRNKHVQSKIFIDQDAMKEVSSMFIKMNANMVSVRDMLDSLRNSARTRVEIYKTLFKDIKKLNQIFTSPPNNVKSQITQGRPARDNNNTTIAGNASTSIREQRGTFSLPAEYDPNDTKWTLLYRKKEKGLVELLPKTDVYVNKKELQRCIRESNDCKTLARLLLTEVFKQSALSVCSWTGGKAKAFNSVNIDVRPGLDENARMVLLAFVEQQGKKRGWSTSNISAIMSTIRTKINAIRDKHERKCKA